MMTRYGKVIPVRLTDQQWQNIRDKARRLGRTASDLMRWVIVSYLEGELVEREDDNEQEATVDR